jgi:hypothetical protein
MELLNKEIEAKKEKSPKKRKHSESPKRKHRSRSRDEDSIRQKKLLNEFFELKAQDEREEKEKARLPKLHSKTIDEKYGLSGLVHERREFNNKKYLDEFKTLKNGHPKKSWRKGY